MEDADQTPLTRRDALLHTVMMVVAGTLGQPIVAEATPSRAPEAEPEFVPEFVPENDYPFFGGDLPEGYGG